MDTLFFHLVPAVAAEADRLDPDKAFPIEIAVLRVGGDGKNIAAFAEKIRPSASVHYTPRSHSPDMWASASPMGDVAERFDLVRKPPSNKCPDPDKYIVVAHHAEAQRRMLHRALGRSEGAAGGPFPRVWVDTAQLAYPFAAFGLASAGRTLEGLADSFKIERDVPDDTAMAQALLVKGVYAAMMKRYSDGLRMEATVRDFGGEQLAAFRTLVGF